MKTKEENKDFKLFRLVDIFSCLAVKVMSHSEDTIERKNLKNTHIQKKELWTTRLT